jgi:Flp pilus assembly protein TadD
MDAEAALDEAARLLFGGNTQGAERILRGILEAAPENAEALHLAGVARHRTGEAAQARDLVERAIRIDPLIAAYHITLGGMPRRKREIRAGGGGL